jgi:hypothetical protein
MPKKPVKTEPEPKKSGMVNDEIIIEILRRIKKIEDRLGIS